MFPVPDMWRTRPEPDQEREERALVDEYKGEFELTDANENDVNEFVKVRTTVGIVVLWVSYDVFP